MQKKFRPHYLLLFCGFYLVAIAASSFAGDWPQFLGPMRNSVSEEKVSSHWPAAGPTIVWKRDVGQGFAGPVVVGGKLILFHRVDDK